MADTAVPARPVLVEREADIVSIILNRPESRNSADLVMARALRDAVVQISDDPSIRVVVLRSSSQHFMVGGDVRRFATLLDSDGGNQELQAIIDAVNETVLHLTALPAVVLGLLSGSVAGVGCSLAMACDIAIAADDMRFVLAYNALGATPDGGASWLLPRVVGMQRALSMVLLNQPLGAHEALATGLVAQVVAAAELSEQGIQLARRLASGPAQAQARSKALLRGATMSDLATALAQEKAAFIASARTPDFSEGVNAFLQRRKPQFGLPSADD